jgi:hypothetical protein
MLFTAGRDVFIKQLKKLKMNIISLSTPVLQMSTSNRAKRNLLEFVPFATKKKKKRKRYYGRHQAEGLSELFFELKLNRTSIPPKKATG